MATGVNDSQTESLNARGNCTTAIPTGDCRGTRRSVAVPFEETTMGMAAPQLGVDPSLLRMLPNVRDRQA